MLDNECRTVQKIIEYRASSIEYQSVIASNSWDHLPETRNKVPASSIRIEYQKVQLTNMLHVSGGYFGVGSIAPEQIRPAG